MKYFPRPRKGRLPKNVDEFGFFLYYHELESNIFIDLINLNHISHLGCFYDETEERYEVIIFRAKCTDQTDYVMKFSDTVEESSEFIRQFYRRVFLPYYRYRSKSNKLKENLVTLVGNELKEINKTLLYKPGGQMSQIVKEHFETN